MDTKKITFRKVVGISLTKEEYEKFIKSLSATTYRSITEYARNLLLGAPVKVIYRDRSFDDFTETAIELKKSLDALLFKGEFNDTEKQWLFQKIHNIQETLINIDNHVRQNNEH